MAWAQRNMAPRVVGDQTGTVRDEWPFPLEAIREMLSNALIHRALRPTIATAYRMDSSEVNLIFAAPRHQQHALAPHAALMEHA